MNFNVFIRLSIFFISTGLHAAPSDSLIKFSDLIFKNEFEKTAIAQCMPGNSPDMINIFLSPYLKETVFNAEASHQKINDCIHALRSQVENKSESKKVKIIYDYVHKTFFKVYKMENSFCDIFNKGEYNCVSASALYGIVFSKLGIPYQVKETPNHVYLEAYPNTGKVLIETTSPEKGYYRFSDEFAQNYIKNLYKSKLISKAEMDTSNTTDLFNKYYFSSENVSLVQLAGLQYSNYGIYYLDEKNYAAAVDELKKAYYLYPSERNKYTLKLALLLQAGNNNYSNMEQVYNLVTLCHYKNLKDDEISDEVIRAEFSRVTQSQLISNSDYAKFDSSYNLISAALTDTALKNVIAFDYHLELARLGLLNSKDTLYELKHLQAAYAINGNNANLQAIILAYFGRIVEKSNDAASILNLVDSYCRKFSFLDNNDQFNAIKANCLLELSYRNYSLNNLAKGDSYIKEFEGLYEKQKNLPISETYVEKAYMTAAGAYFKKGNYAKSKQLIKSGLIVTPGSFGLRQMLTQF
ncbi:MAG TPA: hypothetical protein VJY62_22820 [Bacteroidia bacterium]|nr:hypothetical protein [Bacteroidia bacterium]